jgi:hypothetical protein
VDFGSVEFYYAAHDLSHDLTHEKERAAALRDRFDELASKIDWSIAGAQLAKGQLTILPTKIVKEIEAFARQPDIARRAAELRLGPIRLVVALIACRVWTRNRAAARVLRAVKGQRAVSELAP